MQRDLISLPHKFQGAWRQWWCCCRDGSSTAAGYGGQQHCQLQEGTALLVVEEAELATRLSGSYRTHPYLAAPLLLHWHPPLLLLGCPLLLPRAHQRPIPAEFQVRVSTGEVQLIGIQGPQTHLFGRC